MNSLGVNQYTLQRRSPGVILISWLGVGVSAMIAYPIASMFVINAAAFRPCSINSSGLSIGACGKSSADITDLILAGISLGAVIIVVCAVTHALRMTRKS